MLKKITILFSIVLLFIFCFFILFKGRDPLEINANYINFYIKKKILSTFANANINMGNISVVWQKGGKDPCLVITDFKVANPNFAIKISNFSIYFKLSSLLKTNIQFSQVLADKVYVDIWPIAVIPARDSRIQEKKEWISVPVAWMTTDWTTNNKKKAGFKEVDFNFQNSLKVMRELFFNLSADSKIEITNIAISKDIKNEFFINKIYVGKGEDFDVLDIYVHTKDKRGVLDDLSIVIKNRNGLLNVSGIFYNLKLELLNKFLTLVKNYSLGKNIGFKGSFSMKINGKDEVVDGNVYILDIGNHLNEDLSIANVNINLIYANGIIDVKNFHFNLYDIYISLMGKMNFSTSNALLRVNISKFAARDLCTYVPDGIVNSKFKKWYCRNIDGYIVNTVISFNGKVNNLINNNLSDVVVVADIENGSIKFDEGSKQVKELNGDLALRNNNLKITVNSAKFQNFTIDDGYVEMDSLNKEDSVLVINGKAVSDAYGLYEHVKFKLDDIIEVTKDKINGKVKSVFNFRVFNLNADDKKADFSANFYSKIDNLVICDVSLGKYDVKLDFGKDFINLRGNGMVNNTQLVFDLKSSNKNRSFTWNLTGDLPAKILNFGGGYVNTNIESVINQDKTGYINGNVDLSELESHSSYLGRKNHFEDHNKILFSTRLKGAGELLIDKLDVIGSGLDIKFSGKLENGNLYLNSSNFKLPDNNFSVEIELGKGKNIITIYGEKMNLGDILDLLGKDSNGLSSDIEVGMDIDNVVMKEDIIIKNVKLNLTCTKGDCSGSRFTGQFLKDNSDILAEYSGIGLEIYTDNSGILLRSLGISKSIKNGKLSFYLSPQRKSGDHYGMLSISNFYVKDAPLLTTLLSMSSLPGIVNVIKNEGVYFDKCNVPFSYKDGTIEIEESWLEGAELGISTSGKFDIKDHKFQVEGQVIPAYSINKSLLKIPIIGKLLTGGKSRGIISIDYKASGDDKNSNVSVNPIFSLTPSLFKRLLEVFDRAMTKTNEAITRGIKGNLKRKFTF
ncbi:YhdP family protein [Wolbachia endosymbiont of Onchocerca volvulus]|uniref:YhdP family protein n=1 Tax=Onchocerca volvulus endobacterium TaxID=77551 RepID=UPI00046D817D|nr:AsmA-like C-terminal domain-containing protein [Wolbachia endosymbiont of Onchocerca volvulus]